MNLLAFFDLETDGTDPQKDHIVEAAVVTWSVDSGCIVSAWSEIVRRDTNAAAAVNGIPSALLQRHGASLEHVLSTLFVDLDEADVVIGHNARSFDVPFLVASGVTIRKPVVDSYRDVDDMNANLVQVAVNHGVPVVSAHRALTDCLLLAGIFSAIWRDANLRHGTAPETIRELLTKAMRPKSRIEAVCSYTQMEDLRKSNQDPKSRGFAWDPQRKTWWRDLATDDVPGDTLAEWGFRVLVIGPVPS